MVTLTKEEQAFLSALVYGVPLSDLADNHRDVVQGLLDRGLLKEVTELALTAAGKRALADLCGL